MRIERLDLRAYGPFTDVVLDFAPEGQGLFVVHGRNEAGKSSALQAIEDALFGIPGQTDANFVHEYTAMRLGFSLRSAQGTRLSCVRRKANKNALRDERDDETIAEDVLRTLLGGVDRDEFRRVFGLDHETLRASGELLLEAATGGEGASSALLSAALGIHQLRQVRGTLEADRENLFKPSAAKPEINALLARVKDRRTQIKERSLAASSWNEKKRDVETKERARDAAARTKADLDAKFRELEIVKRNRGRIRQLAELRTDLTALATVPDLPPDLATRRLEKEEGLRTARLLRARFTEECEQRRASCEALARDFSLLDAQSEFQSISKKLIEVDKAQADRVRRVSKLEEVRARRDTPLRALGLTMPLAAERWDELRRSLAARSRCDELVQQRTSLRTKLRSIDERLADLEREKSEIERRALTRSELGDDASLIRAITSARALGDVERRIADAQRAFEECDAALVGEVTTLRGMPQDADSIASARVPGPQEFAEFERRFLALERNEENARSERTRINTERAKLNVRAQQVVAGGTVPTESDLGERRDLRDRQWQLIRRAWLDGANVESDARGLDSERPLPSAFEHSLASADATSDALRRESTRVAELAGLRAQIAKCDVDLTSLDATDAALRTDRTALEAAWRAVWVGSGFECGRPAEMKDRLQVRERMIEKLARRRQLESTLRAERFACDEAHSALRKECESLSVAVPSDIRSLAALLAFAESLQQSIDRERKSRLDDRNELTRIAGDIAKTRDLRRSCESDLEEWQTKFALATRGLPLRDGDAPDAVPSLFDDIQAALDAHDGVVEREEQIEKIDRDARDLESQARAFQAARTPDLPFSTTAEFVTAVRQRLQQLDRDQERFQIEQAEKKKVDAKLRDAVFEEQRLTQELAAIATEAGATSVEELPALLERAARKRDLRTQLAILERELAQEDLPLATIEDRVRAYADADLEALREPLTRERDAAQLAADSARDAAVEARRDLAELEQRVGTADLQSEQAAATAELARLCSEYARLTLASSLLSVAVERFRKQNETPLLKNASRHFARLTRSRYLGVDCDIDDEDKSFFQVRDPEGRAKHIDSLSDGTRDQLHLALVLGSLELRFDGGAEPMPLVLDDILVHFDDERSLAALEALAEFGKRTQVLLFTHHDRIAEQARSLDAATGVRLLSLDGSRR